MLAMACDCKVQAVHSALLKILAVLQASDINNENMRAVNREASAQFCSPSSRDINFKPCNQFTPRHVYHLVSHPDQKTKDVYTDVIAFCIDAHVMNTHLTTVTAAPTLLKHKLQ